MTDQRTLSVSSGDNTLSHALASDSTAGPDSTDFRNLRTKSSELPKSNIKSGGIKLGIKDSHKSGPTILSSSEINSEVSPRTKELYGLNPPKRAPPSAPNAGPTASDPKTSATLGGKVPISLGKAAPPPPPQANKPKRAIPAPVQPGAGVAGVQSPQHTQQWTSAPAKAKQPGGTGTSPRQLPTLPQRPNEQLSPRTNPSVPKVTSTPPQSPRDQDSGPSAVHTPTKAVTAALTTQLAQALPGHSGPSSGSPTSSAPTSLSASTNSSVQVTPASTPRPVSSEQSLPELSDAEKEKIRRVEKKKARIRSILEAHAEEVQKLDLKSYDAKKATLCQSVIRSWFAKQEYKFLKEQFSLRTNLVKEMLNTEQFYLQCLNTLVKIYLLPLRETGIRNAQEAFISLEDVRIIFGSVEVIYNINMEFCKKLEEKVNTWSSHQKIGSVFLSIGQFLKVYTQYINNYNQAASRLEECKKNKLFAQFLLDCKSLPKVELELSSYLIMPIQRIPRYQLLLDGLVKATPKDHPDYTDLSSALKQIVSVADYMNERKRDVENILHMTNLQGQMLYKDDKFVPIVSPTRRYRRDGNFEVYLNGERSPFSYIFLFTDAVLFTKQKKKGFLFFSLVLLKDINVTEGTKEERPAISLLHEVNNYMIVFNDKDERQLWLQDIEPKQNPQLVVPSRESVEVTAFKWTEPVSPRGHVLSPRDLSPSTSPTAADMDKKKVKDKKKDKEDEDPEKKEKKRNRFLSLRLFKSSKDKDKDDDDSPPSSEKQITPPTKSTEPSPRKMGPAGGEFNLEALKRVGDLLNSQPGGDSVLKKAPSRTRIFSESAGMQGPSSSESTSQPNSAPGSQTSINNNLLPGPPKRVLGHKRDTSNQ
jgi:hypothetical protein